MDETIEEMKERDGRLEISQLRKANVRGKKQKREMEARTESRKCGLKNRERTRRKKQNKIEKRKEQRYMMKSETRTD